MEERLNKYILLKDGVHGENLESGSLLTRIKTWLPTQFLRGELFQALVEAEQPKDPEKIALTGLAKKSLKLECPHSDVAKLTDSEADLLIAVNSTEERFHIYRERNRLEAVKGLTVRDQVLVTVKTLPLDVRGIIWYKGPLPTLSGTMFGVELVSEEAIGHGTTDGTFRNEKFFYCSKDCGVFVGMDRIRPAHDSSSRSPRKDASKRSSRASFNMKGIRFSTLFKSKNDNPNYSQKLKIDQKVVVFLDDEHVEGFVRYIAEEPEADGTIPVGIELTEKKGQGTGMFKKKQLFVCKEGYALFVPSRAVIPAEDFYGYHQQERLDSSEHATNRKELANQQQHKTTQRELTNIRQQHETTQREVANHQQHETTQRELANERQQHETTQRDLAHERQHHETTRQELVYQSQLFQYLKIHLQDAQTQHEKEQQQHNATRIELENKRQQHQDAQTQLENEKQQHNAKIIELENERQQHETTQRELANERQQHETTRRELDDQSQLCQYLQFELQDSQTQLENEQQQHNATRIELENEQQQRQDAHSQLDIYQRSIANSQNRDWVLERDEIQVTDKVLGKGGWGSVKEGRFRGTTVAVKEIHGILNLSSDYYSRIFQREMQMASKCRHPCLLQFIGATNDNDTPLFVTELLETSLRAVLNETKRNVLETKQKYLISLDVARALNYLHLNRPTPIIHRDISSANVLLWRHGEGWRAKVSDYGTANFMYHCTTIGPGAPPYSAPEARTSRQTTKIDVFSYGVLILEMNTREFPDPSSRAEQLSMVPRGPLKSLISRCLAESPDERPSMSQIIPFFEN